MKIKLSPKILSGEVSAIPSKSVTIRALILAMLSGKPCKIKGLYMSDDIVNTLKVINSLGATVVVTGDEVEVIPAKEIKDNAEINVGESATLLRFIVSILSVLNKRAKINATGSLLKRDVFSDFLPLINNGAIISNSFPIIISKGVDNFDFNIESSKTSGIVSGLMIGLTKTGGEIKVKDKINNGYLDITKAVLTSFSGVIFENEDGYIVNKSDLSLDNYSIEGDFSNASALMIMGALCGDVCVKNLDEKSVQGDKKIVDILKAFGADVEWNKNAVIVKKSTLNQQTIDMSKNLDIVPILSSFASEIQGTTIFKNVSNLKYKESDRIESIITLLNLFGKRAEYIGDDLYIYGGEGHLGKIRLPNDHRIMMSAVILGLTYGAEIENVECINKSYPTFLEDVLSIGGIVEWIQ